MTRSVPEWIGKTDDTPVPPRVAERVRLGRDGNRCQCCGRKLHNERADCDHIEAIINGGENRENNLQTLCVWCHVLKTKEDLRIKVKSFRRRQRHYGADRAKKPIEGWRKFDGTPVRNPKLRGRISLQRQRRKDDAI